MYLITLGRDVPDADARAEQYRHFRGETWLEEVVAGQSLVGSR